MKRKKISADKICVITPYQELYQLTMQCKIEMNLDFNILMGNLEEAIPIAQKAVRNGAEIIISRGGTASIISHNIDIPVVNIKITDLDLLEILDSYRANSETILVVGYANAIYGCRALSKILKIDMKEVIVPYDDSEFNWLAIQHQVQELITRFNINTIIGDTVSVSRLGNICERTHLITSGKDAIAKAVEEAINIIHAKEKENQKTKTFQAVLDFVNDGVIAIDENEKITVFNPSAEKIFGLNKDDLLGKEISGIIDDEGTRRVLKTHISELEQIQEIKGGHHILANRIPIQVGDEIIGVVSTFQEISKIQGAEWKIRKNIYPKGFITKYHLKDIFTRNVNMKKVIEMAKNFSSTDATILIEGESGTGKEMLAQSIHSESSRADGPFVAVNCAALTPQLLESELFGYAGGAFTGAAKGGKMGLFEMAHQGTIFLDEIGDMDKGLQAKLLRVLEEKQVMRISSDKLIPINTRVITATNVNLGEQVRNGQFRSDLYYRLNVLNLCTIPLRERPEDIPYLTERFIRSSNKKHGRQVEKLSGEIMDIFQRYSWFGNVRELKNIIERIVLIANKDHVDVQDISLVIKEIKQTENIQQPAKISPEFLYGSLSAIKSRIILEVLKQEGFNKSRTSKRLEIDRSTLERLLDRDNDNRKLTL